jgi:F0F1-type ATP synthase membrane subunit b/b'
MSAKDYTERTLLKLRRKYSKDETIAALNKKISEIEFENGVLKSEIDELQYKLKHQAIEIKQTLSNEISKKIHESFKKTLNEKNSAIKSLRKSVSELSNKLN